MSSNGNQHPARSVEFLSRLHDGDLDAAERARFEAHRSHCAECRRSAVEFEDAISLFRTSRSMPPRADLAARILRKVQSTNRPRAPFSPRFRLDLAAAALLATALLALVVSTPITVRQAPPTVPVAADRVVANPTAAEIPAAPAREPKIVSQDRPSERGRLAAQSSPAPAIRKEEQRRNVAEEPAAAREKESEASEASADRPADAAEKKDELSRRVAAAESPAIAAGGAEEPPSSTSRAAPLRLTYHSIDGYGAAPPLISEGPVELSAQERGREYVLLLDSQGVVREVRPAPAPEALSRLTFRPGSRPRRLLVRVE
jgi:hypothetical protein